MEVRTPGRPKKKRHGIRLSAYVEKDIYDYLHQKAGAGNISSFVEEALRFVMNGHQEVIELQGRLEVARAELQILQKEKERLEKENEHLKKKVAKLEIELEKWREKWGGQKTLTRWNKRAKEIQDLVEQLIPHIEEGLTWREALEKLGILDIGDRMDILHKLYKPVVSRQGERNDYLISQYIKDYVLVKNGTAGYDNYVFKSRDEMPSHLRSAVFAEVSAE